MCQGFEPNCYVQVQNEIALHQTISHDHVVKFWVALEDAAHLHIVMEYCAGGDLRQYLNTFNEQRLRDRVLRPLLSVLVSLHNKVRSSTKHFCKGNITTDFEAVMVIL